MASLDKLIAAAARKYGLPPEYLQKLIQYESKGDPNAISPTGARGLGQFTSGTGAQYGLNRRNINDPAANIDATARLARDNYKQLEKSLGRPPQTDELYLAHLQGAEGAARGFRNPNRSAVELWPEAVRFNLPKEARGRINSITAKEYQDLHKANFNNAGSPTPKGTIDIGDQPSLKTLNPPSPKGDRLDKQSTIPLSQLAPTEQSTSMARYPSYDQAVAEAINQVNGGRGGVQVAGLVLPAIRGPGGRMRANPLKTPNVQKGLPSPEQVPGARTPTVKEETENTRRAYERQQELKAKADRVKRGDPAEIQGPQQQGAPIAGGSSQMTPPAQPGSTAPIQPRSVPTERITRDQATKGAAAVGAGAAGVAGVDAASRSDPAVSAVEDYISGQRRDPAVDAAQRSAGSPADPTAAPATRGAQPMSPENPDTTRQILSQAMPVLQEALKDPQTAQAAQVVAKKVAETAARRHAVQADMQNDPTYYQMMASRGQMPGGMQDDRAMERAVMMDNQRMMQARGAPSARGPVAGQVANRGRPQVPVEQGDTGGETVVPKGQVQADPRGLPPEVAQQFPPPNAGSQAQRFRPGPQALPYGYGIPPGEARTPAMYDPSVGANIPQPNAPPPPMDPVQQMLMQFYTQGGSTGGGVMP